MEGAYESVGWDTIWKIQRDICSLYYWQLQFGCAGIDGDLPYDSVYKEAYWEILDRELPAMPTEERSFLLHGCLFFVVCLCLDLIDGSGSSFRPHLTRCEAALLAPIENVDDELRKATLHFVGISKNPRELTAEDLRLVCWIKRETVHKHFESCARRSFDLQNESN